MESSRSITLTLIITLLLSLRSLGMQHHSLHLFPCFDISSGLDLLVGAYVLLRNDIPTASDIFFFQIGQDVAYAVLYNPFEDRCSAEPDALVLIGVTHVDVLFDRLELQSNFCSHLSRT